MFAPAVGLAGWPGSMVSADELLVASTITTVAVPALPEVVSPDPVGLDTSMTADESFSCA